MQGKSILVHTWFLTGSSTPDFGAGAVRLILHFVYVRVLDYRMLLIVNLRKNTLCSTYYVTPARQQQYVLNIILRYSVYVLYSIAASHTSHSQL